MEAGIVLTGTEIKSIRAGRVSLGDAYVKPEGGELWLLNAHIARYEAGSYMSHDPPAHASCCCTASRLPALPAR